MAKLSDLVEVVADAEGLPPSTVNLIAREVREAGLIKTGGRGTSAALMDLSDATALLIAVNATTLVREAVPAVRRYSRLEAMQYLGAYVEKLRPFSGPFLYINAAKKQPFPTPVMTFGRALEELMRATARRDLPVDFLGSWTDPDFRKAFSSAEISLDLVFFKPRPQVEVLMYWRWRGEEGGLEFKFCRHGGVKAELPDRYDITVVGFKTIQAVANLFRV